ncbi:epidermal growth factor receptor substrate 15-like 1 [Centruroides sculpturatus]|uniref:epidermal growth factor receptor substrate 15-like 1 n=1 Tax=Centruroides sculpturatus TaxID=218467 RepID=UPI000C6EFE69|nr:epidermal growth factor receptor substrate 15-like 1 [Centruroides sculpturatus]
MAGFPSPTQIAGSHAPLYEALYQQVDPAGTGCVSAMEAAAFLKRSGLSDAILSKIWDLSDPNGNGFLDKRGFFVALKLIALAQSGKDIIMANISVQIAAPQMGDLSRRASAIIDWSIKPTEQKKYEEMFNSLGPVGDRLPGTKVKPVMLNSKLPLETLGKIWDLSDIDQDGFLDKDEFILAMHLVYKALENVPVPSILPPELYPTAKRKKSLVGGVPVLPDLLPGVDGTITGTNRRSSTPGVDVAIKNVSLCPSVAKLVKSALTLSYGNADVERGFSISRGVLPPDRASLPERVLKPEKNRNLCDVKQNGKLNTEQFALAMYLVNKKLQGGEIPTSLTSDMIPPTLRPKPGSDAIHDNGSIQEVSDSSGNKEIDIINNEIKELQKEKMTLEQDIAQKEADLKIKNGELKNLQNEKDALTAMLRQLEIQKGEAQKRLDDLDNQKSSLEKSLSEMKERIEEEMRQVENMKKQLEEQQSTLENQESELNTKRQELTELRQEETKLEQQINSSRTSLDNYSKSLQDTQLQINQTRLKISQLQEQHQQMTDALQLYDTAIKSGDFSNVNDSLAVICTITPPLSEPEYQRLSNTAGSSPVSSVGAFSVTEGIDEFKVTEDDPFKSKDPFSGVNGFTTDPFGGEDPFKSDPFKGDDDASAEAADPFGADPFKDAFSSTADTEIKVYEENSKCTSAGANLIQLAFGLAWTRLKISQLQEQHQQMTDALQLYDTAIKSGDFSNVNDSLAVICTITPPLSEPEYQRLSNTAGSSPVSSVGAFSVTEGIDEFKVTEDDPFKSKDPFSGVNGFTTDPFGGEDPFKSDPFKGDDDASAEAADPFGADPFKDAFSSTADTEIKDDPFKGSDPFSNFSIGSGVNSTKDPFDPFGDSSDSKVTNSQKLTDGADPFGADPFSPAPVAPPRPESPTPALPPKKGKAPPPRPAPPKHASGNVKTGPTRAAPAPPPPPSHDPFMNTTSTTALSTFGLGNKSVQASQESASFQDPFSSLGESNTSAIQSGVQDPFDPFGLKSEQDPFASSDGTSATESFANFADFEKFVSQSPVADDPPPRPMSEEEQFAWAAEESIRLERNRQRRAAEKEQADLELALALSRAEIQTK